MIGSILLLAIALIIGGCAVYLYLKGTFIKAFAIAIAATCASAVALGFYSAAATTLVSLSGNSDLLVKWGPLLCFVVLFILAFAILQTIVNQLTRRPIDLGRWPERIGRIVCGIFLGFVLSCVVFDCLKMAFPDLLQTSTMARFLVHKEISTAKQAPRTRSAKPSGRRRTSPPRGARTTPQRGRLSDVSKSIVGDQFDE